MNFPFSKTGCHTKVKEPGLPYYLPLAGRRIVRFIPFPRILLPYENANSFTHDLNSVYFQWHYKPFKPQTAPLKSLNVHQTTDKLKESIHYEIVTILAAIDWEVSEWEGSIWMIESLKQTNENYKTI